MCRVRYTLGEQRRCFPAFDGAEGLSGWSSHDIASLSALLASLSATWEIIGSGSGWEKKVKAVLQPDARKQFVAGCTPASFSKVGAPTKTQRSGFREERTSIGMSELSAQAGSEGYGDCEDEDRAQRWRLPQLPNVSCWDPTFQANKAPAAPVLRRAVFFYTGRGAFSFVKTKENGGRIPHGGAGIHRRFLWQNANPQLI